MNAYPFLPLISTSLLLFRGGTFLNYIIFLIFTLLISPNFIDAPDYYSYEMWFNSSPSLMERFSPGMNIIIKFFNLINIEYSDFRIFILLLFFGGFSLVIFLYENNNLLKNKIIDYKTIFLINSFPFILLSCTVIRQGISTLGVAIFIIFFTKEYFFKNKFLDILTFLFALFLVTFHALGLVSLLFIWLFRVFNKLKQEKISLIISKLFKLKIKKDTLKELLSLLFFLPTFLIISFFQGLSNRFTGRLFTSSQTYDLEFFGLFFLIFIALLVLIKKINYLDIKFKILFYLNISNIFLLFISTKAFGRLAISTVFYNLILFLYSNYKIRINKVDFGFFYLILSSFLTLLKLNYFKFLTFYF